MRQLLEELGFPSTSPSILNIDNQSCISVAKNPEHHGRMKHLDLRFFWLRDQVVGGLIQPQHIPGVENPADIFTKPLPTATISFLRSTLGIVGST